MVHDDLFSLCEKLFPITRSITGDGVRQTLRELQQLIPLEIHEIASGTPIFDWSVPLEWNLERAYIQDEHGNILIDTNDNNLHVVGYSHPVNVELDLDDLQRHLYSLPNQPDLIPYRTAYYDDSWGFCLTEKQRQTLQPGRYRAVVEASLTSGSLTYGECFIPGKSNHEYLVSTHICHPSLANDNLSGISIATHLASFFLDNAPLEYGLRFIFIPGTIGAVAWLATNEERIDKNLGTLVLSGVGDKGPFTYKRSKNGEGVFDLLFETALREFQGATLRPYLPYGYDERQFCSPGIDMAAGCLMRTPYGEYDEYHTSGDNLNFLSPDALVGTFNLCRSVLQAALEQKFYVNIHPNCEPQLGKRGLYNQVGGDNQDKQAQLALLWMLSYSDGKHSLQHIAHKSDIPLNVLERASQRLVDAELLQPLGKHAH